MCQNRHGNSTSRQQKRFTHLSSPDDIWKDPMTPYPIKIGFNNYNHKLSQHQQEEAAMECARRFAEYADLEFKLVDTSQEVPNIVIEYLEYDGASGKIGEGLSPYYDPPTSYLRLDQDENWIIGVDPTMADLNLIAGILDTLQCERLLCTQSSQRPMSRDIYTPTTKKESGIFMDLLERRLPVAQTQIEL